MLLALDTATQAVTVALHDGRRVVAESTVVEPLRHGELLAPAVAAVLAEAGATAADLTRIAVGVGPGPFTGLRVGLVTAATMAAAGRIPAVGVCTLDVLAAAVTVSAPFLVATDARRREVYWAGYDEAGRRRSGPAVDRPDDVRTDGPVAGRGAALHPDAFHYAVPPEYPSAAVLAECVHGGRVTLLPVAPLYLRRPDVGAPAARKRVS